MRLPAYILMSALLLFFLASAFMYSFIFYPDKHPVPCLIKTYSGKNCPSCGFSTAFSLYSHGQLEAGKTHNERSWPVFLFFCFQFTLRSAVLLWFFTTHKVIASHLIKIDLIISISFFLLAFLPLLII